MEKDPVCGMAVDPIRASAQEEHGGKNYFFCCSGCATKFRAEPTKYLNQPQEEKKMAGGLVVLDELSAGAPDPKIKASGRPAAEYICPMDPEVSQDHPGACPKCGMALEPAVPIQQESRVEYTCPMHPQIVRSAPGFCPICGMALELRDAVVDQEEDPELISMTRRFWTSVALTIPILVLAMSDLIPGQPLQDILSPRAIGWIEFVLATPVVL